MNSKVCGLKRSMVKISCTEQLDNITTRDYFDSDTEHKRRTQEKKMVIIHDE